MTSKLLEKFNLGRKKNTGEESQKPSETGFSIMGSENFCPII